MLVKPDNLQLTPILLNNCRLLEPVIPAKFTPYGSRNTDLYIYITRIFKDSSESGQRKYIVDIVGDLPVILMELDNSNEGVIMKTYIYANSQIIAQHTGDHEADRYFYLHDRLGSVRQVIDTSGDVVHLYTYEPFGEVLESDSAQGAPSNAFMFTGQYFDSEIDQYYLRARQYDPHIARFTARDPVFGEFEEPLTLHVYLYCLNDPMNGVDPRGEFISLPDLSISQGISLTMRGWQAYTYTTKAYNFVQRIFEASDLRQVLIITASFAIDMGTDYAAGKMFDSAMRGLKKVSLSLSGNKLNHIFGKAAHKLGPLLKHFGGSRELAGDAIEKAFQEAVESGVYAGQDLTKGIAISVAGELVVVRGEIVDGIARVGTVFIP